MRKRQPQNKQYLELHPIVEGRGHENRFCGRGQARLCQCWGGAKGPFPCRPIIGNLMVALGSGVRAFIDWGTGCWHYLTLSNLKGVTFQSPKKTVNNFMETSHPPPPPPEAGRDRRPNPATPPENDSTAKHLSNGHKRKAGNAFGRLRPRRGVWSQIPVYHPNQSFSSRGGGGRTTAKHGPARL